MIGRSVFFALAATALASGAPAQAATMPLTGTVAAFAEGGGHNGPLVCGLKFAGLTPDFYAINGSINFMAESTAGPLYAVAKINKVRIVEGVAQRLSTGLITANGTPLTDGWRAVQDAPSLLLAEDDPAQVLRSIEMLRAGTVLAAKLTEKDRPEAYNLGTIDQHSDDALHACLQPFLANLQIAQAVGEAIRSATALGLERGEVGRRLRALPPARRREMAQKLVALAAQVTLARDLESGACTRAAEVQAHAAKGDPASLYLLSSMYRSGWCVARDERRFHANLEDAAARGSATAAFDLAGDLERGVEGYDTDYAAAQRWYGRAMEGGDPRAMVMLGDMWIAGRGKSDPAAGVRLLERAAQESDDPETAQGALDMLGLYYAQGKVLPRNLEKARTYGLRTAAECDALGMVIVAMSYDAPATLVRADAWAEAAARHASPAQQYVATGTRDSYRKRLGAAEVAAAQAMIPSLPICLNPKQRAAAKN